jgi:hypothetical protein
VRFAGGAVLGFERLKDAEQFLEPLRERLTKFGLELHPEKMRLIEFGRFAASAGRGGEKGSRKPSIFWDLPTSVGRTTRRANSRFTGQQAANAWQPSSKISEHSCASGCTRKYRESRSGCSRVVSRYFQYHAIPGNVTRMRAFRSDVLRSWLPTLRRRSQYHRMNSCRSPPRSSVATSQNRAPLSRRTLRRQISPHPR